MDVMYNIMLQADVLTINSLCKTSKMAHDIVNDKAFWINKFTDKNLESLLIHFENDDFSYLEWYSFGLENIEKGKNILKINALEKNRRYNKTNGIFKVLVEGDGEIVSYLFKEKVQDMDKDDFTDIIFKLLNNEYQLILTSPDDKIHLGKYSIQEVEKLLGPLLHLDGVGDEYDYDMIYEKDFDNDIYNHRLGITSEAHRQVLLIRRGMWEIINLSL